MSAKDK